MTDSGTDHDVSPWCTSRAKRTIDIALGILSLPVALLLGFVAAVISLLAFRANPLFVQRRRGVNEEVFSVVKIRSLPKAHPDTLGKHHLDEQQHTRWSRFLRNSHLDELPQVLNIIGGSMSFVGPRPMIDQVVAELTLDDRLTRSSIKPGLTGPWQVSTAGSLPLHDHPELDNTYVRNARLRDDVRIVLATGSQVIGRSAPKPDELIQRLGW